MNKMNGYHWFAEALKALEVGISERGLTGTPLSNSGELSELTAVGLRSHEQFKMVRAPG